MAAAKGSRSKRNIETRNKKAARTAARPPQSRNQGNTAAVRKRLKKAAGKARATKVAAA